MKPFSNDLRQRVIDAYLANRNVSAIAKQFDVSNSFVRKLAIRYADTGKVDPSPHSGGAGSLLGDEQLRFVEHTVATSPGITLEKLCKELVASHGVSVSVPTMCRVLKRLKIKKIKPSRTGVVS